MRFNLLKLLAFMWLWLRWSTYIHVQAADDSLKHGNFVLQQLHPNGTNTLLWQSFDYPTYTLIPTRKLGVNHKTGHHWLLVSKLTEVLATSGAFSLEWEPKGQELIMKKRGKVCWRSGELRNNRFEHIPEDAQRVLKYSIVSNEDEDSFSFTSTNENHTRDGGCQRWQEIPKCRNPGDVFTKKILYPNYEDVIVDENENISHSDCEASCIGFRVFNSDGTGCLLYHWNSSENYTIGTTVSGLDIYLVENTRNITPHHHGRSNANFLVLFFY
ncbi:unnamed protein product [Sphenostylis stenocarpa]|uniref:Bulb-type lectin domain-containing protein n=1 Tax=Sphenostylis stenocarpa TaxID=92480 RepID=A0AA86W5G5_9FABA|nr:unnamed protein product [Sphenostylis stenocarpa]